MSHNEIQLVEASRNEIDTFINLERKLVGSKTYFPIVDKREMLAEFDKSKMYLIQRNGKTVGSVSCEMKAANHAYIGGLIVDPQVQSQGIGRAAVRLLLDKLNGVSRIDLVTHPENQAAMKLYSSLGFTVESRHEDYFGDGQPRVVLAHNK